MEAEPVLTEAPDDSLGLVRAVHSNGYKNQLVVYTGTCILYGFTVYSSNVAAQWIQVIDTNTAPAAGVNPAASLTVAATANLGVYYGEPGFLFLAGCVI